MPTLRGARHWPDGDDRMMPSSRGTPALVRRVDDATRPARSGHGWSPARRAGAARRSLRHHARPGRTGSTVPVVVGALQRTL